MAETENGGTTTAQTAPLDAQPQVKLQVIAQYIRDLSFENAFRNQGETVEGVQPHINVQVGLDAKRRKTENQYEVLMKMKITSENTTDKKPIFLIELEYGGIFQVDGVPEEQLHPFILIECPRMMFPYVRRIVSDLSADGGFMPLNLENVDFVSLYRQQAALQAAKLKEEQGKQPQNTKPA